MVILKRFACFLGFDQNANEKSQRKKLRENDLFSGNLYSGVGTSAVRIIHPGGCEEWHHDEIIAENLMESYPGMCVARPIVFKNPHESVLSGDEKLLFGSKYYLVPSKTVDKLKRRHDKERPLLSENHSLESDNRFEESFCSAKDFYDNSKENWSKCSDDSHSSGHTFRQESDCYYSRKCERKKKKGSSKNVFIPPIQKPKMWRGLRWEPNLDSIQEISP